MLIVAVTFLPLPDAVAFAGNALAVAAFGVGIVRYQLFDIEVVLSRAVVYALLTAGALAAYLLAAAVLGVRTQAGVGPGRSSRPSPRCCWPGRGMRLQRIVDRVLYGERRDPLRALTDLGEHLGRALDADAVLPAVVDAVRETLRLPYAAVHLTGEDRPACASGAVPAHTAEFPLSHAGAQIGVLRVGLRRGETALSSADARLLGAFARPGRRRRAWRTADPRPAPLPGTAGGGARGGTPPAAPRSARRAGSRAGRASRSGWRRPPGPPPVRSPR